MLSNHKLQTTLEEISEISKIGLALYDENGKQVAATFQIETDMRAEVVNFAASMAESQMLSGFHFFKVIAEQEVEYILLARSTNDEAYMEWIYAPHIHIIAQIQKVLHILLQKRMCPGTFSRLRRSLATSTLYAAVRILAERVLLYRKLLSCKIKHPDAYSTRVIALYSVRLYRIS